MPALALFQPSVRTQIHLLFAVQLVSMGAMEMSGPFWPVHLKSISSNDWIFGLSAVAVYIGPMLGIMLTSSFWGRLGDRHGHKIMMIRALAGLCLTQLALAYSTDVFLILMLRFLQGACAGYIAPAQAYGVSIEDPSRRARLFAYLQVATNVGSLLGALAGGIILDQATFFLINLIASLLCALCLIVVWACLPSVKPTKSQSKSKMVTETALSRAIPVWRSPPVLGLLTIIGLLLISRMITQMPFSLYVTQIYQVEHWIVGLCYGLLALGFVLSASLWAKYMEGQSLSVVLWRLGFIVASCSGAMLIAGLTNSVIVFITIYFLWGILLGATTPVLVSIVSQSVHSTQQGYILGITQSISQFASIAGIALGGVFSQVIGLQYTYFFVAAAYTIALIAIILIRHWVGIGTEMSRT